MNTQQQFGVRPEIESVLTRLRRRIRTYVFFEGVAWVLVAVAIVFWLTLGLNWTYFKLSRLELPRWFRIVLDVAAVTFIVGCFLLLLMQRLLKHLRTKALALLLERRFPELDDRLITAVEADESLIGQDSELGRAMLQRTVDRVSREARELPVNEVLRSRPLATAATLAVLLVTSVATFWLLNKPAMAHWYRAFVGLDEEYWDRDTKLMAQVVAEPASRIREFDEEFVYKHPRGADLTLLVTVPEEDPRTGKKWIVPEDVYWDYEFAGNRGGAEVAMNRVRGNDRQFRQTVTNLLDDMTFIVEGGDYRSRRPYRVRVVDPPTIDEVTLDKLYPRYTGMGRVAEAVQGSLVSIPMETGLVMQGRANKPLVGLRIETDHFHLTIRAAGTDENGRVTEPADVRMAVLSADGVPMAELPMEPGFAERVLTAGEDTFHLPLALSSASPMQLAPKLPLPALPGGFVNPFGPVYLGGNTASWLSRPLPSVPLTANTLMRIYLEDTDGIVSREPSRLTVNGVNDQAPAIEANFRGIGEFVTTKASIPVVGKVEDDYGVVRAGFEYRVATAKGVFLTGPTWLRVEFANPPTTYPKSFRFEQEGEPFERFDLSQILVNDENGPRRIKEGEVLHLNVYAQDGDNLNGPHITRAKPKPEYVFKIVSREELLTILYQKELGLLERFRVMIEEVEGVAAEVRQAADSANELARLRDAGQTNGAEYRDRSAEIGSIAKRSLQKIAKDLNDSLSIQHDFEEILEEIANNGIETRKMVQTLRELIIEPLGRINSENFPAVDLALVAVNDRHENELDPRPQIARSDVELTALLNRLQAVLKEMEELASYQELVGNLQQMIEDTKEVKERTAEEQLEELNRQLKGLELQD